MENSQSQTEEKTLQQQFREYRILMQHNLDQAFRTIASLEAQVEKCEKAFKEIEKLLK